ncbi:hypothetical protein JX265_000819 [Neoarthrinium moseri]|uniref:Cytomegalovirus gH-receptor family protein n=1 Tax=Neoarthrinium moseri TaxID=1658444 RepID=A0A9P9WX13_9PEZI|nr:hypothetical protein JX265_000819 [Neoarthrinium moseri]
MAASVMAAHRLHQPGPAWQEGEKDDRTDSSVLKSLEERDGDHGQDRDVDVDAETRQLPSPRPSPAVEAFPVLEMAPSISSTPPGADAGKLKHDDSTNDGTDASGIADSQETKENTSSSTESSTNSSDESSSSSAGEDAPAEASPTKPSDSTAKPRTPSTSRSDTTGNGNVRKLSASQMQALATSPDSLPIAVVPPQSPVSSQRKPNGVEYPMSAGIVEAGTRPSMAEQLQNEIQNQANQNGFVKLPAPMSKTLPEPVRSRYFSENSNAALRNAGAPDSRRPPAASRTLSQPPITRRPTVGSATLTTPSTTRRNSFNPAARPPPLNLGSSSNITPIPKRTTPAPRRADKTPMEEREDVQLAPAAPIQPAIPLPPMSLHTHLQLELAGVRPSPLYIYRHSSVDVPYESSAVKFERLLNALLLPPYLEATLTFGALACLDAFLYTFTLLPLRFVIAVGVLVKWWAYMFWKEVKWVTGFVWQGIWRLWRRGRRGRSSSRPSRSRTTSSQSTSEVERSQSRARETSNASESLDNIRLNGNAALRPPKHAMPRNPPGVFRHRRTKSMPSDLTPYHKADLLQGAVIVCSSLALMAIDASRMYHFIRAQSAMKLYVIFNLLEVGDRLLSAIGQDILECLFSSETLSRNSLGRSKILLPFGMFILSLIYNVVHAVCLFYQVITLNVAVNSYSNALLSLLMSNQFVEIKGSVFKKIEKENLFQLTCSDVVERFQLWIILIIIGMRNIVEVGGLSVPGAGSEADPGMAGPGPIHTSSNLPASFTLLPSWLFSGEVLSPFLIVIGSEMLVDWIKHAYVNKFNNVKPTVYRRMLDIFCKDYYTNAFGAPALTRRIGLPLLPLSCLFIRASVQIYHMFLATHLPPPMPTATTELSVESSLPSSPAMIAALDRLDHLLRNALGRAVYGSPYADGEPRSFWSFTSDDAVALLTMLTFFFLAWLVLLLVKLLLGMALLKYARERYASCQAQEQAIANGQEKRESFFQPGKRVGGWGMVEVGDERRKLIYADDPEGLKRMRERERKGDQMAKKMEIGDDGLEKVTRYEMIAKRIW